MFFLENKTLDLYPLFAFINEVLKKKKKELFFFLTRIVFKPVFSDRLSFKRVCLLFLKKNKKKQKMFIFLFVLQLIINPVKKMEAEGFIRLRTIMLNSCLRRTKEGKDKNGKKLIDLPGKVVKNVRLLQSESERLVYQVRN
jgi:hypothetical protein